MKATQELRNEHQGIALMLRIIEAVGDGLGRGQQIDAKHLVGIIEFLSIFVDKCHHGKEEEFLFPALEAVGVLRDGGPIGVLLDEHEQGRKLVAKLKEAVTNYTFGNKTAAATIQLNADQYVALLTQHIGKENTVLFPMADAKLDADKDTVLFEAFEQLERERIGVGKHEEFHVLLDQLRDAYLSWSLAMGDIGGIPRVLDAGQCNDSYSLAVIALKLKEAFGLNDINDLPVSYDIAWYEQKAVAVLLALLFLGVKGIRLGPTLPAFLSPNVAKVLVEKFDIKPIGTVEEDIAAMMNGR